MNVLDSGQKPVEYNSTYFLIERNTTSYVKRPPPSHPCVLFAPDDIHKRMRLHIVKLGPNQGKNLQVNDSFKLKLLDEKEKNLYLCKKDDYLSVCDEGENSCICFKITGVLDEFYFFEVDGKRLKVEDNALFFDNDKNHTFKFVLAEFYKPEFC